MKAKQAAKAKPRKPKRQIEVRFNDNETVDEVFSSDCLVHLEQLSDRAFMLIVQSDYGEYLYVTIHGRGLKAGITEYAEPLTRAKEARS